MPNTTTDLYTTVKNVSGKALAFGFLGAHGVTLADNASYSVPGDLVTKLGAQRSQRKFKALEYALTNGLLDIVKSPSVYLRSADDDATKELALGSDDTSLGTSTPSFKGGSAVTGSGSQGPTGATGPRGATGPAGA
jgi:hypothetical protein